MKIRAANAIVLNDTGETTVSLGVSLVVSGPATGTVDIQTVELNSLNNFIELTAYNTLDLLSLSSLTVTGQSSINLTSSNINLFTPSTITSNVYLRSIYNNPGAGTDINITAAQTLGESAISITRNASGTIVDDTVGGYTLNTGSGLATSITANNSITLSTITSINLNSPSLLWNGSPIGGGVVVSTFNTLATSTISGNPLNYLTLLANRSITQRSLSTITNAAGAWFSGDITATTFNGAPLPSGGGWVGTATSDLDMTSYKISGCNAGSSLGNFQPFKFIYEPPTAAGQSAEFAIQAHPQDAGVVFNLRYGVNLAGGYGYLLCEWPGYIVVPMKITGQDVELDGGETVHLKAGSGDVTIAATGGISLSNTTLTNGGRLTLDSDGQLNYAAQPSGYTIGSNAKIPLIQCGKVYLTISEDNTLIGGDYSIPVPYDDNAYSLQLTYSTYPPYAPDAGIVWSGQAYTSNTFQIAAQGSNVGAGITLDFFWQTCGKYPKGAAI